MTLAKQYGADRIWIVNVGHFKGYELPTEFFLDRDQRFASPSHNIYRVLTITHPSGGRIRLTAAVWSHWRQLTRIVDPSNRLGLDLVDSPAEDDDDDDLEADDIDR